MSTTTLLLSDTLPSTIPMLDAEGTNWVIFYICFMDAIEAKGFWDHFDGSSSPPALSESPTAAETAATAQWDKDERSAKALLTQQLPDSTVMEIHSKKSVKEHWEAVVREYTVKGVYAQTEIRAKFLMMPCPERGNAKEFLRGLRLKKEELAQVGVRISDEEYVRGHPHYPIPITKPDDHGSAPAPTSIPTHYIPPHRRVYSKNPIVT